VSDDREDTGRCSADFYPMRLPDVGKNFKWELKSIRRLPDAEK